MAKRSEIPLDSVFNLFHTNSQWNSIPKEEKERIAMVNINLKSTKHSNLFHLVGVRRVQQVHIILWYWNGNYVFGPWKSQLFHLVVEACLPSAFDEDALVRLNVNIYEIM